MPEHGRGPCRIEHAMLHRRRRRTRVDEDWVYGGKLVTARFTKQSSFHRYLDVTVEPTRRTNMLLQVRRLVLQKSRLWTHMDLKEAEPRQGRQLKFPSTTPIASSLSLSQWPDRRQSMTAHEGKKRDCYPPEQRPCCYRHGSGP